MSHQGVIQLLRQGIQIALRMNFFQRVSGQFQFAVQNLHVLLFKMVLDRISDQQSEHEQYSG